MPHGYCYAWQPLILWLTISSDLTTAISYFSIPIALVIFVKQRHDLQFRGLALLFALFITLCGLTHLFAIYTIWHGAYGLHALIKAATAVVSTLTAIAVFRSINTALSIPSRAELAAAINDAAEERIKREAETLFRFTTRMVPAGLLVIDNRQTIRVANMAAESMFGYGDGELADKPLSLLLASSTEHHSALVKNFLHKTQFPQAMAAGRIVTGRRKDGSAIPLEITISVHDYEAQRYAFAHISDASQLAVERGALIEQSYRLKRAIDATNDGVWEWNLETDAVWYSPRLMEIIGEKDGQPDIELWRDHIHPEDRGRVAAALNAHFQHKDKYDLIYRGKVASGAYEWMHTRGDTLFDRSGRPMLMSGTLTNVHEVRILREQLIEKSHFLDQVLKRSLAGLFILNLHTRAITFINPEYTNILGYEMADLNRLHEQGNYLALMHPEERFKLETHMLDLAECRETEGAGMEYRLRHKNGDWIWCFGRNSIYSYDNEGQAKEMLGAFFEITDLKKREAEVGQLALYFSSTFDQASVGMAQIGLDGTFLRTNAEFCRILGYSQQQLLGKHYREIGFVPEADHEGDMEALLSGTIDQFDAERCYTRQDGSLIWAHLTASMVCDETGGKSHLISVIKDINQRKQVELELAASNASLERFAYSASHDLQEPLRKISSFAGLLEDRLQGHLNDRDARFQLNRISDAAQRMGEMINSLLQLSRFSSRKVSKSEWVFSELLEQVRDDLSGRIYRSGAEILLESDALIAVEKNSFQQVIRNLLINSIQYAKPNASPRIVIRCYQLEDRIQIRLRDNGVGIPAEKTDEIFEPFYRLGSRDVTGTGMGLAICKQIMSSHNARIWSEPRDDGAVFIVDLPRVY